MLFHEIYGTYYQVVSEIISEALNGGMTDKRMTELVQEKAFAESGLSIPSALKSGQWPLMTPDRNTVLHHRPTMPLTLLQKRWLKALLSDPRIALFNPDTTELEDVEPLYKPDAFVLFDQYSDGDPYEDESYIAVFRMVLQAVREKRSLRIRFRDHTGLRRSVICKPCRLEYSVKDDKFRMQSCGENFIRTINVSRIRSCVLLDPYEMEDTSSQHERICELTLLLHNERNALERVLLHFSHFAKETRKLESGLYQIDLRYDREDETELLIRVLSFGPMLEVQSPPKFRELVKERLIMQRGFGRAFI